MALRFKGLTKTSQGAAVPCTKQIGLQQPFDLFETITPSQTCWQYVPHGRFKPPFAPHRTTALYFYFSCFSRDFFFSCFVSFLLFLEGSYCPLSSNLACSTDITCPRISDPSSICSARSTDSGWTARKHQQSLTVPFHMYIYIYS